MGIEGGSSVEAFESRHNPERDPSRVEHDRDVERHISDAILLWFIAVKNGLAGFKMDPEMRSAISKHISDDLDCVADYNRYLELEHHYQNRPLIPEEILAGRLFS